MRKIIAVIGDSRIEAGDGKEELAFATGKALVDHGYMVQCGGGAGIMLAVCKGAKSSSKASDVDTIAIAPTYGKRLANEYCDLIIPTGMDVLRDAIVANADAVVVIGGAVGTLNELTFAWTFKKLIIAYDNVEGWGKKLAGTRIDNKVRVDTKKVEDDIVFAAKTPDEVIEILERELPNYSAPFEGIWNHYAD